MDLFKSIKQNYEHSSHEVLNTLSKRCVEHNDLQEPYAHVYLNFLTHISLTYPNKNTDELVEKYTDKLILPKKTEIFNLYNKWMQIHEPFSQISVPILQTYLQEQPFSTEDGYKLFNYLRSLSIIDCFDCTEMISERNNEHLQFVPYIKEEKVLVISTENKVHFKTLRSVVIQSIEQNVYFDIPDYVQRELVDFISHFSSYEQLDILEYFLDEDVINHQYMVSDDPRAPILVFRKLQNVISDIQFITREEWDFLTDTSEMDAMNADMTNVVVTITSSEYKNIIERKRLTKKQQKRENIPETCCICLEEFKIGNQIHKTPCNHYYHAKCLRTQLCKMGPPKCPLCRSDVRDEV